MGSTIRILHVEDEPDIADLTKIYLERENNRFNVDTATDPEEGLAILAKNGYDCIVSDFDMPGQTGIQFLETVREEYDDIPFILFTGKGSEEVASEAITAGVSDYLQKGSGTERYSLLANRIVTHVEKQVTQTKLLDREKRLNLFFEQSPLGVIRWDENFKFARMNERVEEILGYDDTDLKGQSWEAIVPDSDRETVREIVDDLLDNKGGYHSINHNVRKDGEGIVCEWHNRVVSDENNDVIAIYSQFQDITERKVRERDLLETKRRLELALQESDAGIWEWNITTNELYWSNELLALFGLSEETFEGSIEALEKRLHPDDVESTERSMEAALETDGLYRVEQRIQTETGEYRWLDVRGQVVENGMKMVGIGIDITAQKEREHKLERHERTQRTILNISTNLINTNVDQIDDQINRALRDIGVLEQVDRSYIFQFSNDFAIMDNSYEWCAEGISSHQPDLRNIDTEPFGWFMSQIRNHEPVVVRDITELPPEAEVLEETLISGEIVSIIIIPLTYTGNELGFIGFDWLTEGAPWTDETLELLHLTGNTIANALARKMAIREGG